VCRACFPAWGWKSPAQPGGGEGLAMRKGVTARWGLKEARSDSRDPMDKNRIGGSRGWTSGQMTAKSVSTKGPGCKSGGCAAKAGELTSGGLLRVPPIGRD
jgi:hypothetical protein